MKNLIIVVSIACASIAGAWVALAGPKSAQTERVRWQPTLLVQLGVEDLDRAIAFYTDTLGFSLQERNDQLRWARIDVGIRGVTIGLGVVDEAGGSGTASFNIGVTDIDHARATLESKGVEFLGPTLRIPGVVELADFHDPDGNMIRLAGHASGYGDPE